VTDKPRCRPLPPSVIEGRAFADGREAEAELVQRMLEALRALPEAERTAVVASIAYDEGVVGAAMELDVETGLADRLSAQGLEMLREALRESD
jgi:DNA-directed RNA polymerase specialized sigma24 family protein